MPLPNRCRWLVGLMACVACESFGPEERDPNTCPQTAEFMNFGCARVAVILTAGNGAPASGLALYGVVLDSASAEIPNGLASELSDSMGRVGLQLTWFIAPPESDAVRLRLVVLRPGSPSGIPVRVDSMDAHARFVSVGQRPSLDTLRWRLPL
jgi:hypothetical protein